MRSKYEGILSKAEVSGKNEGYYVYCHKQNGEIVYIGKGCGNRCIVNTNRPYNISKENISVEILFRTKDSTQAHFVEQELIQKYKPKYNKYCKVQKKSFDEILEEKYDKMFKFSI